MWRAEGMRISWAFDEWLATAKAFPRLIVKGGNKRFKARSWACVGVECKCIESSLQTITVCIGVA